MISNKCIYALKAVLELAMRQNHGPVTINDIAKSQDIPPRFLEAILRQLKQAGITDSLRGKEGGYLLARPAGKISIGEIVRLIEGPLIATSATVQPESKTERHALNEVWARAEAALGKIYDGTHFADLAKRQTELQAQHITNYSI